MFVLTSCFLRYLCFVPEMYLLSTKDWQCSMGQPLTQDLSDLPGFIKNSQYSFWAFSYFLPHSVMFITVCLLHQVQEGSLVSSTVVHFIINIKRILLLIQSSTSIQRTEQQLKCKDVHHSTIYKIKIQKESITYMWVNK